MVSRVPLPSSTQGASGPPLPVGGGSTPTSRRKYSSCGGVLIGDSLIGLAWHSSPMRHFYNYSQRIWCDHPIHFIPAKPGSSVSDRLLVSARGRPPARRSSGVSEIWQYPVYFGWISWGWVVFRGRGFSGPAARQGLTRRLEVAFRCKILGEILLMWLLLAAG